MFFLGSGDLDKAFETIEAMHSEGIDPDVITYTSLMKACCTVGGCRAVEIAEETFHAMQQRTNHFSTYVMPNERTYSWLIHTHLRVDGVVNSKRTTELLLEMSERNLQPELITYSFCIKAACLNGDVDSAILILDRIRNNSKIRYDAKCWQSVLSLCEQKQKIGLCRLVKEEMSVNSNFY